MNGKEFNPGKEYTPEQALRLLMEKLRAKDSALAKEVQEAIDQGKDVEEVGPLSRGRNKTRLYRKTVPYSYGEALELAVRALQAYFIEQPRFINSSHDNMQPTVLGEPKRYSWEKRSAFGADDETKGKEKNIEVELRTETQLRAEIQLFTQNQETLQMGRISSSQLEEQERNVARLQQLVQFDN